MKDTYFDELIKAKVASLDTLTDIEFDENGVWGKVHPKIFKKPNGGTYFVFLSAVIILLAILNLRLFTTNPEAHDQKEAVVPVKKETVDQDITPKGEPISRKVQPEGEAFKRKASIPNNQKTVTKETPSTTKKVAQPATDTNMVKEISKISNQTASPTATLTGVPETRAYVHVYRPGKVVGALNFFTFKANGKKIGTITNGEHEVFLVEAGLTEFEIKRKKIKVHLEARKRYYLRTELVFLGKTKFELVSESFAKEELGPKKDDK